jgi:hypothetical protein
MAVPGAPRSSYAAMLGRKSPNSHPLLPWGSGRTGSTLNERWSCVGRGDFDAVARRKDSAQRHKPGVDTLLTALAVERSARLDAEKKLKNALQTSTRLQVAGSDAEAMLRQAIEVERTACMKVEARLQAADVKESSQTAASGR